MIKQLRNLEYIIIFILIIVNTVVSQNVLYKVLQYDKQGIIKNETYRKSILNNPENVLVLYNINYLSDENNNNIWDGYEIADYYKVKRNIPEINIQGIKSPTSSKISRAQYDTYFDQNGEILGIRQQIEDILLNTLDENEVALRNKIKYIVLTKGIPHKIIANKSTDYLLADYSSVDAAVAMIFNGNYDISWRSDNPYYNQDPQYQGLSPFVPEFYTNSAAQQLCFLVTRLDGYDIDDIKGMIDRAADTNSMSRYNAFIIDGAQKPYDRMQNAYTNLKEIGAMIYPDPWIDDSAPIVTCADSVIGIVTHGTHAGLESDYIQSQFNFKLPDGAIFTSYESINGINFDPTIQNSQGQIADFIRIGGSGALGSVDEPYAAGIADESVLFPAYFTGYTFAEAAYMSIPYLDWTNIVIGDPLMRIGPQIDPQVVENFRVVSRFPVFYTSHHSTNTVAQISFTEEIDSTNLPSFYYNPGGMELVSHVDKNHLYLWPENSLPKQTVINYKANNPIYSINGDSLIIDNYTIFITHNPDQNPISPRVYRSIPSGINVKTTADIKIFFSQKMIPETIYPLLGNVSLPQTHHWIDDCILRVSPPTLTPDTLYSFYIDEHAKSVDNIGLAQKYFFSFETKADYIAFDVDNDGFKEFAFDLNNQPEDGYEFYIDTLGIRTFVLHEADLDHDGQIEFIIMKEQEYFPSYYWNPVKIPVTGYHTGFTTLDDDEDGMQEYAFDAAGIGYFTNVYDPNGTNKVRDINFVLISHNPYDDQQNVNLSTKLTFEFSLPVDTVHISNHLSILPDIDFNNIKSDLNGRRLLIYPADQFIRDTLYSVLINQNLNSIDNKTLLHDYDFKFHTAKRDQSEKPVIGFDLSWQQNGDFLLIYLQDSLYEAQSYELFLTNSYLNSIDSLNQDDLYLSSKESSWFLDLNSIAQKSYLYLKINYADNHCWSDPMVIFNYPSNLGDNLSLPITYSFLVDSLSVWQNNIQSVSQWDAEFSGWKSAKQIGGDDEWSLSFQIQGNRGIMMRTNHNGHLGWIQSISDTFLVEESDYEGRRFRSLYNPYHAVNAAELASIFGNASRLAVWDNSLQGWKEAVYDSTSQTWINNFQVDHMTPIYFFSADSFAVSLDLGIPLQKTIRKVNYNINYTETTFPSITKLLRFPRKIRNVEIFKDDIEINSVAGCGIESDLNIAYINLGNLNNENIWKFSYYDESGNLLDTYVCDANSSELINLPSDFRVDAPYPNPFNSAVTIPIYIPNSGNVDIRIYNILGQRIYSDEITFDQPQLYKYRWSGHTSSGLYITQVKYKNKVLNKKVILIK